MNEGITAIRARIAEIENRFNKTSQTQPTSAQKTSGQTSPLNFADTLAQAQAATTTADQFSNGRLPASALLSIGNGDRLTPTAARAFLAMKADASRSGVSLAVNDSYRSYDEQVAMAKSKGLYGKGGLAAVPGTSDHGRGISVDLELDSTAQTWMKRNASRYGFVNDVSGESWHWSYKP